MKHNILELLIPPLTNSRPLCFDFNVAFLPFNTPIHQQAAGCLGYFYIADDR